MKYITMNGAFEMTVAMAFMIGLVGVNTADAAQAPVNLGSSANFVILSEAQVTDAGPGTSLITGDVGVHPAAGTFIEDLSCSTVIGTIYDNNAGYTGGFDSDVSCLMSNEGTLLGNAIGDMDTARGDAQGRTPNDVVNDTNEAGSGTLNGLTFNPGLHTWSTAVSITGDVYLNGGVNDVWIFQIADTLDMSSGVIIHLTGGAQASNIFWAVSGGVTLGSNSIFEGNILAETGIATLANSTVNGRLLAQTAITLDGTTNTVTIPVVQTDGPVFIDANTNGDLDSGEDSFTNIQTAIDSASNNDTIVVTSGTYNEQLVINKDVTVQGMSGAVIRPTGPDNDWDIQFVAGGSGATLEGFTLDFNGSINNRPGRGIGVSDNTGPVVTNVTIQNNDITMGVGTGAATAGLEGVGIQTGLNADVSGLLITNNNFHAGSVVITDGATAGEEGMYINPNAGTGMITISDNIFDGQLFTGISVESNNVLISGNTVTRPAVAPNTNGIRVNDFVGGVTYTNIVLENNTVSGFENGLRLGSGTTGASVLTISLTDNTISNNTRGIWVRNDAAVVASGNSITGNTSAGAEILLGSNGTLNAVNNWWGSATGPTHTSNNPTGTGDVVSDNVTFDPECVNDTCTTPVPAPESSGSSHGSQSSSSHKKTPIVFQKPVLFPSASSNTTVATYAFTFVRDLTIGSQGIDVTELQHRLTLEGVYHGPITGFFGLLTQSGVAAYQSKMGIMSTGYVGPLTKAALNRPGASNNVSSQIAAIKLQLIDLIRQLILKLQAEIDAK